ncbi:DNA repair and recombination protein RadB [Candidatus Pacearchaeota archaeon]|nr:DNA repair and recombination protein RadB [Candidatus Pacearchaeota archaeon]
MVKPSESMANENKISAGSYDLNKFLFGGYETDIITTIYGPGGSGKTNLCILVAVSQAKKGNKVIYVDTEGGFSIDRVSQILQTDKIPLESVLKNIMILKPTSFEEQEESFEQLLKHVKKGGISLIVIDSIAMLYRLELGDAIKTEEVKEIQAVNRKLANQLRILNEISRKENIPVIVTNQVYSSFSRGENNQQERQFSMVGGDLLKYWSKCIIEMQNNRGRRSLVLRKHRSMPEKELEFEITNLGIRKRGLF